MDDERRYLECKIDWTEMEIARLEQELQSMKARLAELPDPEKDED